MSKQKIVGIFTFFGIILFLISVLFFIKSKIIINKNNLMVMFFNESVQGLKVGSPVVLKGIEIGKVVDIGFINNEQDMLDFDVPVYISFNNYKIKSRKKIIEDLISHGLKAKLSIYSYITGQLMIEFIMEPNIEAKYVNKVKNMLEIPTIPSSKKELSNSFKNLPIENIVNKIDNLLTTLNKELPILLKNSNKLVNNLNVITDDGVSREITENLNEAVKNFSQTMKSIKNLTDYLERHPESIIRGKKGD